MVLILYGLINLQMAQLEAFFSHCVIIVILYLSFMYSKELNIKKASMFLIVTITVSILVSAIFAVIPELKNIVVYNNERFMAFFGNPNQMQIFCVIGLAVLMVLFYNHIINLSYYIVFSLVLGVSGIFTMSKSYIICLLILVLVFLMIMFQQSIKKGLITTSLLIVALATFVANGIDITSLNLSNAVTSGS